MSQRTSCPDNDQLYAFFSPKPENPLAIAERKRIALHLTMCEECSACGELLEKSDEAWKKAMETPDTEEDRRRGEEMLQKLRNKIAERR